MVIFDESSARELVVEIPIVRRTAAPKNKRGKYRVFFILTSGGVYLQIADSRSPNLKVQNREYDSISRRRLTSISLNRL
jgi:hypothetical protein